MKKHKLYLSDKKFLISLSIASLFFIISLVVNFYAVTYATRVASDPVTDIILSNIPPFDVDGTFVYGFLALCAFIGCICVYEPKIAPFVLKSAALFTIIRAVFISLTHIGTFPTAITSDIDLLKLSFGGDLFFSGHTGLPFLMALIFWGNMRLRILFLCTSVFFGVIVLLGHLHYTIDVAAAFFITYTIYIIAKKLFKRDEELFRLGL